MALPQQLKAARMTNATKRSEIDNKVGELESALADIFGYTLDSDITALALSLSQDGKIENMPYLSGTTPGFRLRDTGDSDDIKIELTGGYLVIYDNTGTEGTPIWTARNSFDIATGLWESEVVVACSLSRSFSVPNITETLITGFAALYDADTMLSGGSNERITIPAGKSGLWVVGVNGVAPPTFSGTFLTSTVKKNGSSYVVGATTPTDTVSDLAFFSVTSEVELNATDYLTNHVTHDHGSSKGIGCGMVARYIGTV